MPIYRLSSSGTWQKLAKIYRLSSSGIWQSLASIYRLSSSGAWQKIFSSAPDTVTQTSAPTFPGGSGEAFTSVTKGSAGTYTNINTGYGIVTTLVKIPIGTSPSSNTETKYGTDLANTYTVTQSDATTPVYRYYTEDKVKNVAGTKTFYFYSSGYVQAYVGNITDNYNRTVATGLGTSSSGYIYSSYANNTVSWQVNGSRADNSSAVSSGASATSHPLQTIEVGSSLAAKTNKTYSIDIPDGKGGQGVAFWTTAANSWYAVTSYFDYDTSTTTILTCSGTSSWTSTTSSSVTDCNTANPYSTTISGYRCGSCTYINQTTACSGTGTYSSTNSSTSNCNSANPTGPNIGDACGTCTYTGSQLLCTGSSFCIGTNCYTSNYCGSVPPVTPSCTDYRTNQSSCPGTGSGTGIGQRCSSCTSQTTNTDTFGLCRSTSLTPVCPSCVGGTTSFAQYNCSTGFWQCRCRITTTTYNYYVNQASYYYSVNQTWYNFTYPTRIAQYNFTYPSNQNQLVTQYTYNTRMKIWSAVSGTVTSEAWDNAGNSSGFITSSTNTVSFDPSQFIGIYTISATTNNNTVTATAYNSGGSQMGSTLIKTFSSPTKANANNETSAGVIKAYSANNVGTLYDNLSIT